MLCGGPVVRQQGSRDGHGGGGGIYYAAAGRKEQRRRRRRKGSVAAEWRSLDDDDDDDGHRRGTELPRTTRLVTRLVSYGDDSYTVGDGSYTVGDGSYTVGDCISETLTFNDASSVDNIAHGCGHNIEGIFVGAAGVYKGVTTSQLDELAAETAAAMTASHPDYASVNVLVLVWVLGRWGSGNFNWGFDFLVL
ncbi:hypothetical protein Scep_027957 [Stephania cephalantha]|uniref:Uncharacterized protein n=1 Tax=Stephania cephalantha TaxID=152367 RepID=A0AAP0HN13_9MAGN